MTEILLMVSLGVNVVVLVVAVLLFARKPKDNTAEMERRLLEEIRTSGRENVAGVQQMLQQLGQSQTDVQSRLNERQDVRLKELREQLLESQNTLHKVVTERLSSQEERLGKFALQNEQKLENIRRTMEERVSAMQAGNEKKLEEMRHTVDEKLQKTLNERLKQSFSLVNENLDRVQKGLGEMQTLASGVGDLKKVLSNVKTRGILGEIQLGAILEEVLSPEQYEQNVATVKGSSERVEFAVKLPGDGEGESVWLPIDAKFPMDAYANLLAAYESADAPAVESAAKQLEIAIRKAAKDIRTKYISVPYTTDFGIMFLPVEGLYAEVVRRGLIDRLQQEYKINIAGPTTMAALLSSLQMGFRTLAIQKRSSEVWKVLGEVKSEFDKFEDVLSKTKKHLELATKDIDQLVGTRTNQIQRKLRGVTSLEEVKDKEMLEE